MNGEVGVFPFYWVRLRRSPAVQSFEGRYIILAEVFSFFFDTPKPFGKDPTNLDI